MYLEEEGWDRIYYFKFFPETEKVEQGVILIKNILKKNTQKVIEKIEIYMIMQMKKEMIIQKI